jgi:L-fuculose-phosphate aldolase
MKSETEHRQEIVAIGQKMYQRGYVAATDGNISAKLDGERLLITPSGCCLGEMRPEDLVVVDQQGRPAEAGQRPDDASRRPDDAAQKPSSELPMHLEVYGQRPDVGAVIHAHPPLATAFTVAGISLAQCVIPEVVLTMGIIPTTKYATPATEKGREAVRELIRTHDALILDRHGTLTVGPDLIAAYHKLEKVEHAAQVTLAARQLGNIKTLPTEEVSRLEAMRSQLGLGENVTSCSQCGTCGRENGGNGQSSAPGSGEAGEVDEEVVDVVTEEVLKVLEEMGVQG